MSVTSCTEFLTTADRSPALRRELRVVTAIPEIVALAGRHGFEFDADDLAVASSTGPAGGPAPAPAPPAPQRTVLHHHEFDVDDVPGLAAVADELPALMTRPPAVDLERFDRAFVAEDMASLSRVPEGREFERFRAGVRERTAPGRDRPDFHLVNLDEHVDHDGYPAYFAAKQRVVDVLEDLFADEVRCSGNLWYPPGAYRLWHTNETQPGWRMYLVALDAEPPDAAHAPFFRYRSPETGELVTLPERRRIVRFFRAEQDPQRLFWHCIANPGPVHRWSFGFAVPDGWWRRFPADVRG